MTPAQRVAGLADLADAPMTALSRLEALPPPAYVQPAPVHKPAVTEEGSEAANELEALVPLALEKYREVLMHPVDFGDLDLVKLQVATAANVVNATLKVDEGRLKRRKLDILPKLLEIISQEERTMGKIVEAA